MRIGVWQTDLTRNENAQNGQNDQKQMGSLFFNVMRKAYVTRVISLVIVR